MSSVYIHIPFCKQACHYCNFHFTTSLKYKDEMIDAIMADIKMNHHFLNDKNLVSIYFGGGTPSILDVEDIDRILLALSQYFTWGHTAEITLEANPDDIELEKLRGFKNAGVNRLSLGIQSFQGEDLLYMNRAHNRDMALKSLELIDEVGFTNITADLIYGTPTLSHTQWEDNIETLLSFKIPHISAYALTVEPHTALNHLIEKKDWRKPDDDHTITQYDMLINRLMDAGYEHYEISNFARAGYKAVHNSRYWERKPFLGIGPSAHSYDGDRERRWNLAHNVHYMRGLKSGEQVYEYETLTDRDIYNEYIMTGLRLSRGVSPDDIKNQFPDYYDGFMSMSDNHISAGILKANDKNNLILTRQGKFIADRIASDYFIT